MQQQHQQQQKRPNSTNDSKLFAKIEQFASAVLRIDIGSIKNKVRAPSETHIVFWPAPRLQTTKANRLEKL